MELLGILGAAHSSGLMNGPDPDLFELLYRRWPDLRPSQVTSADEISTAVLRVFKAALTGSAEWEAGDCFWCFKLYGWGWLGLATTIEGDQWNAWQIGPHGGKQNLRTGKTLEDVFQSLKSAMDDERQQPDG